MTFLKQRVIRKSESAVSPVVGVMLMLVVTIIIAAVVSGFSGGLIGGQQKAPTLSMDVKIWNTGSYLGSGFTAKVLGVSQPINTKDLKIVTSWTTTMKDPSSVDLSASQAALARGTNFNGGNTSLPNSANVQCYQGMRTQALTSWATAPFGIGNGFTSDNSNQMDPIGTSANAYQKSQWFGQYALQEGTILYAMPYGSDDGTALGGKGAAGNSGYNGATPYKYTGSGTYTSGMIDPMQAVLGSGWEQLRVGDTVNVKVIYVPTGAAIFNKDVSVEG